MEQVGLVVCPKWLLIGASVSEPHICVSSVGSMLCPDIRLSVCPHVCRRYVIARRVPHATLARARAAHTYVYVYVHDAWPIDTI